ncbi:ATP synthase F1 subunit gamma [Patescibacteria group bacterium]|nr:ATP synthase F1 subunit gamma [Patescibacteria group bacterium]
MANLLLIKRRIQTAQNVSKTTRAMQMIATSKLKKAQDAAIASKPYVDRLTLLSQEISEKLDEEHLSEYMKKPNAPKTMILVLSPDKGLCGGLITNIIKALIRLDSEFKDAIYLTVGKKTEKVVSGLNKQIVASFNFGTTLPIFDMVYPIAKIIDDYFLTKKIGTVKILYTGFSSVFLQVPKQVDILPIQLSKTENLDQKTQLTLFEPEPNELLPSLLRHYLEMSLYQTLLESYASEQAARMIAMKNATDNAQDIVEYLRLEYNKGRQEKITNEILNIGGGLSAQAYE